MLWSNTIQELSLVFLKGSWGAYARKCQLREVGAEKMPMTLQQSH